MPILTPSEVKGILGIADNDLSKDNIIEKQLPLVESFFFRETNNYCEVATEKIFLESDTISFEGGNPSRIIDSSNQFVNSGFKDGLAIRIKGSYYNDGAIPIKSVTPGELIPKDEVVLVDEDFGLDIRITIIRLPKEAKLFIAKLVEFYFPNRANTNGIESERFDEYSVKYIIKEDIPDSIMKLIENLRNLSWA
ncbi:MAG: hypothetical protein IPK06_04430 [Ignavibacteriae bacterium]|nr:hypothetical protein [Ignavibacteriota bacterium]